MLVLAPSPSFSHLHRSTTPRHSLHPSHRRSCLLITQHRRFPPPQPPSALSRRCCALGPFPPRSIIAIPRLPRFSSTHEAIPTLQPSARNLEFFTSRPLRRYPHELQRSPGAIRHCPALSPPNIVATAPARSSTLCTSFVARAVLFLVAPPLWYPTASPCARCVVRVGIARAPLLLRPQRRLREHSRLARAHSFATQDQHSGVRSRAAQTTRPPFRSFLPPRT